MNKKLNLIFLSTLMITSLSTLSSCNSQNDELVIWAWNKNVDALNAGIESYKENVDPSFKARVESFARLDIDKKFKTASQNANQNVIGDIVLCDGMSVLSYYDIWSNIFTDLSNNITKEELKKLVPSTLETVSVDNKLIGLPLDVAPTVVFANKTLWNEEDIYKIKTNGWTWDEYIEYGLKIKEQKGQDIFMTSYNLRNDDRIYRTMVSQKGEWFMDMNYNTFVGNDNSINAMQKIKDMKDKEILGHIDTGDYKSLMKNNKIAAQIQGFFLGGQLKDVAPEMSGQWDILPLPKWNSTDGESASITGGSYLYANSKLEGSNKDNAINFIKWMTLNESISMQSLSIGGVYPALKTTYELDEFSSAKDQYFSNEKVWKNVAKWSTNAKAIIATKYNGFNYDTFIKSQEKILFTNEYKSISEELKNAAKAMNENAK